MNLKEILEKNNNQSKIDALIGDTKEVVKEQNYLEKGVFNLLQLKPRQPFFLKDKNGRLLSRGNSPVVFHMKEDCTVYPDYEEVTLLAIIQQSLQIEKVGNDA